MTLPKGLRTHDSLVTLPQRLSQRRAWTAEVCYVNAIMVAFSGLIWLILAVHSSLYVYRQSELGVLDSNKLKVQEALRLVPNVTLRNSYSTSRGIMWVTVAMYRNVLKPQGSWLYKLSGYIPHMTVCLYRLVHALLCSWHAMYNIVVTFRFSYGILKWHSKLLLSTA